jgi:hypothetical protein
MTTALRIDNRTTRAHQPPRIGLRHLVGVAAIAFSAVYFVSDILELVQGDFSLLRLSLTYTGETALPIFVLGLYVAQRPHIGRLGLFGAVAYAYSYVFFTGTVVYAIVARTPNYAGVTTAFGAWMTVHGVVMLVGGLAFGFAVVTAGVLPRWTGIALMVGVVLVVTASGLPTVARTIAEAVPATAFAGMGVALLRRHREPARV